jgi:hypothetical protein
MNEALTAGYAIGGILGETVDGAVDDQIGGADCVDRGSKVVRSRRQRCRQNERDREKSDSASHRGRPTLGLWTYCGNSMSLFVVRSRKASLPFCGGSVREQNLAELLSGERFEDTGIGSGPLGEKGIGCAIEHEHEPGGLDLTHGDGFSQSPNHRHAAHGADLHINYHHLWGMVLGCLHYHSGVGMMDAPFRARQRRGDVVSHPGGVRHEQHLHPPNLPPSANPGLLTL